MKKTSSLIITDYVIKSDKIPKSFNGFKIVQLSDMHSAYIDNLADTVKSLNPDIICSTGDMANDIGSYRTCTELVNSLAGTVPFYMVSGNHDLWRADFATYEKDCKNAGAIWLHNETLRIWRDDSYITISGTDDPFTPINERIISKIEKSIDMLAPNDTFNILLFHRANLFDLISDKGFDLILSGHMHGGQIRLPFLGGVFSPRTNIMNNSRLLFPKYSGGHYEKESTHMIVSKGLGNSSVIPRFFNPPEVCSIELYCK